MSLKTNLTEKEIKKLWLSNKQILDVLLGVYSELRKILVNVVDKDEEIEHNLSLAIDSIKEVIAKLKLSANKTNKIRQVQIYG